jgi:hypothetical protein
MGFLLNEIDNPASNFFQEKGVLPIYRMMPRDVRFSGMNCRLWELLKQSLF